MKKIILTAICVMVPVLTAGVLVFRRFRKHRFSCR